MRFGLLIAATIIAIPAHGEAKIYKPGSVGYLYESCQNMLEAGEKLEDIYQTYCAAFMEGYLAGASISNAVQLPPPRKNDPCEEEKAEDYARINARVCPNFPDYLAKSATPSFMISTASEIIGRWIDFNLKTDPDFLDRDAAIALGDLIQPGPFCDDLAKDTVVNAKPITINPALLNIEWKNYLKIQNDVTIDRKYAQCKDDLNRHDTDKKFSFDVSWCGGEIQGFMAGLRSTSKLQSGRPAHSKQCDKQIARLYRSLNITETMCLKEGTKPIDIGRLFVQRYERGIKKDPGFANLKALGAVGYETIYRGFLCVPPEKISAEPLSPMPK